VIDGSECQVIFASDGGVIVGDVRCFEGIHLLMTTVVRRGDGSADADGEHCAEDDLGLVDDDEGLDGREVEEQGLFGLDGRGGRSVGGIIVIIILVLELKAAVAAALAGRDEAIERIVAVFFTDLIHHSICLEFPLEGT